MAVTFDEWSGVIRREYLDTFIPSGGAAIRFVVADHEAVPAIAARVVDMATRSGMSVIEIDTAQTRLHMLHLVFYAIVARIDWDGLLQARLERLVKDAGYRWPEDEYEASLQTLATLNDIAPTLLRNAVQQQITRTIWHDAGLVQDFRNAAMVLLEAQLTGDEYGMRGPVMDWLKGDLRSLALVRSTQIGARIGRHNARAMLISLCHFLRSCNHKGLLILLDLRQLLRERRDAVADGLVYSPAAVMDCYEVLRQIIDDTEHFEGAMLVAVADMRLINDDAPKRAINSYDALKMRIWDDVRPEGRDNPLSPLVTIAG